MTRKDIIREILSKKAFLFKQSATSFAPSNIALIKYWGKRNVELNLPETPSFSISTGNLGAKTKIQENLHEYKVFLNGRKVQKSDSFYKRLVAFMDEIKPQQDIFYTIETFVNIPVAAGLASSACGFAALIKAFDALYTLKLSFQEKSILARMASGSASRSFWHGFVEWRRGQREDGMDSFATVADSVWDELCLGFHIVSNRLKSIGSTSAMNITKETSPLYDDWIFKVQGDLASIKTSIQQRDFEQFGTTLQDNAESMHETMRAATPQINYDLDKTLELKEKIKNISSNRFPIYYTQDAGPNLKVLFLKEHLNTYKEIFKNSYTIFPFLETSEIMIKEPFL